MMILYLLWNYNMLFKFINQISNKLSIKLSFIDYSWDYDEKNKSDTIESSMQLAIIYKRS